MKDEINIMHASIDDLDPQQLRERYHRGAGQWLKECEDVQARAYDYWAKIRAQEAQALGRVQRALIDNGSRKSIPVAVVQAAIRGEDPASDLAVPKAVRRAQPSRPIVDVQLPLEVA